MILKKNILKDRVILVTGASRGIGSTLSKIFAEQGATVILLARNVKKLEQLYDEIESKFAKPAIYPFNLANATPKDYEALRHNIEKQFDTLDGLLFNAAILGSLCEIEHIQIEEWYRVLQVNLNSSFLLTKSLLPLLKKSKDASMIFTIPDVGLKARAYWGPYAVSKFGLHALMQILAAELEENNNIRVNSINPGKVKTDLRKEAYPFEDLNNLNQPEELADLYLHLMGTTSSKITGKHFNYDEFNNFKVSS